MSDFLYSFISFRIHYSFYRDIFIPSDFAFFYTVANKHRKKTMSAMRRWSVMTSSPLDTTGRGARERGTIRDDVCGPLAFRGVLQRGGVNSVWGTR